MDIGFYNSLKYVLENDPEPLELTFTVLEESFGEVGMIMEKSMCCLTQSNSTPLYSISSTTYYVMLFYSLVNISTTYSILRTWLYPFHSPRAPFRWWRWS